MQLNINDGTKETVVDWPDTRGFKNIFHFSRCSIPPRQYGFVTVGVGMASFTVIIPRFITTYSVEAKNYLAEIKGISSKISRSGETFTIVRRQRSKLLHLLSIAEKEYETWKNELATPAKKTLKQQKKSPVPA